VVFARPRVDGPGEDVVHDNAPGGINEHQSVSSKRPKGDEERIKGPSRHSIVLLLSALLALALSGAAAASESFVSTTLTNNDYDDFDAQVSGDRVVWSVQVAGRHEVFTWTPGGADLTQLIGNDLDDWNPIVSGDRVVWEGFDGSDYEILTATYVRHEQTDPLISRGGDWATTSDSSCLGGSYISSRWSGPTIMVSFTGTYLAWITRIASDYGIASVSDVIRVFRAV
jgi:hypothetical protein